MILTVYNMIMFVISNEIKVNSKEPVPLLYVAKC